jgi:transposase-like protein
MCNMDAEITTKKECPKCKSNNVQYQGLSHSVGAGQPPPVNKHQFKCQKCGTIFYYVGKNP